MRLLILGTGGMANVHAESFSVIKGVEVAGCADLDRARAEAFAAEHGGMAVYGSLEEAIATGKFDAVANATPDAVHYRTTMQAIEAGLHVFCEKPLATNHADAEEMTAAINRAGLINGVNLTYRNVSALQAARTLVEGGKIGPVRHFEASYLQSWLTQPAWGDWRTEDRWLWRLSTAHGSQGVLGDVGIHILDFLTYAAGSDVASVCAQLRTFGKAEGGRIGDYELDANDSAVLTADLASGAVGVIHATRFATGHLNDLSLRLYGLHGGIEVKNTGLLGTLRVCAGPDVESANWRNVRLRRVPTNYQRFAEAVRTGTPMNPDFATACRLQAVLDAAIRSDRSNNPTIVEATCTPA